MLKICFKIFISIHLPNIIKNKNFMSKLSFEIEELKKKAKEIEIKELMESTSGGTENAF